MSLLKGWLEKSGLVTFPDEEKKASTTTPVSTVTPAVTVTPTAEVTQQPATTTEGVLDPKMLAHFEKVIADANIPGPDFFEFSQALNSMGNIIKEDAVLYPAAFASFKTQPGAQSKTVGDLCNAAEHYINAINNDNTFQSQVDTKRSSVIEGLSKKRETLTGNLVTYQNQIAELNKKIAEDNNALAEVTQQIAVEESKLNIAILNFQKTKKTVIETLQMQLGKMRTYIKA